ncbi:hypothetical protein [Streptomyces liangshanensis]|uniref:hypothetical protein n=1 Tax=Streptomyces liangshanensis TaxID=2717324 RepID=UPI0036DC326A
MDRIGTPTSVMTMVRPSAGLAEEIERQEREDDARGPEPENSDRRVFIPRPRPRPESGGSAWL